MPEKNAINIDFHSHILPGIDDGAPDVEVSKKQLFMLKKQGVEKVFLTSHFDFRFESKDDFIEKRGKAYEELMSVYEPDKMPQVFTGAEIYMSRGMENYDFSGLELENTGIFLIEFPREPYGAWMADLLETLLFERDVKVMIAHMNRVVSTYEKNECKNIFDYQDLIFQINTEAFRGIFARDPFKGYSASGLKFVIGTDTHDLDRRAPDFDKALKKLNSPALAYIKQSAELVTAKINRKIEKNKKQQEDNNGNV